MEKPMFKGKRILVPLDGSEMAEAALPAAAYLSDRLNAAVTLFHVIERDAPVEVHGQRHLRAPKEAEAYLEEISERLAREAERAPKAGEKTVDIHVHAAQAEDVAASIARHALEMGCGLIVMCSHGRGRALHLLLGSIAQKVIAGGDIPVLIIRPEPGGAAPAFSCRTLLLPLDGNPEHEQALPAAGELAEACGSVLHIAVAVPEFESLSGQGALTSRFLPGTMSQVLEMSVEDAEKYLRERLLEITGLGLDARAHVLRGDPATAMDGLARSVKAGLIVMATHAKRQAMDAFWDGNVPHKISSLSRVPLLLVPVKAKLSEGERCGC